jgi:hypothetical protein
MPSARGSRFCGQTAGDGRRAPLLHLLPYLSRNRYIGLPGERGTIENAQAIAAHESLRTTKLYDRSGDEITLDEVERISIKVWSDPGGDCL